MSGVSAVEEDEDALATAVDSPVPLVSSSCDFSAACFLSASYSVCSRSISSAFCFARTEDMTSSTMSSCDGGVNR